jgi:dephospho-CoA kinase
MAKKVIIITGPIGSGKSTATAYLSKIGFKTIDLDIVSNNILTSKESISFIDSFFPTALENNTINKETLADIVFNDEKELVKLEGFLHPKVLTELQAIISESEGVIFVEVSAPRNLQNDFDCLVIFAPEHLRKERLKKRGMEIQDIENRINSQQDEEWWLSLGTVLYNQDINNFYSEIDKYLNINKLH